GISIRFKEFKIAKRQDPPVAGVYCAVGEIDYPGSHKRGWLLYVKPSYHGTEPVDVRNYANIHKEFPHESTADQWFSESQLESYRALGAHVFEMICTGGSAIDPDAAPCEIDLKEFRTLAERYIAREAVSVVSVAAPST